MSETIFNPFDMSVLGHTLYNSYLGKSLFVWKKDGSRVLVKVEEIKREMNGKEYLIGFDEEGTNRIIDSRDIEHVKVNERV